MLLFSDVMTTWQHRVNLQLPTCIKPNLTILINKSVCFFAMQVFIYQSKEVGDRPLILEQTPCTKTTVLVKKVIKYTI